MVRPDRAGRALARPALSCAAILAASARLAARRRCQPIIATIERAVVRTERWRTGRNLAGAGCPAGTGGRADPNCPGGASAPTCGGRSQPVNPSSTVNLLLGVAVLSSCNVWAVGYDANGTAKQALIEH